MRLDSAAIVLAAAAGLALWRAELYPVSAAPPRPLDIIPAAARAGVAVDAMLPIVPVGTAHVSAGGRVLVLHVWAPWQRHAEADAIAFDSLATLERESGVEMAIVCFEPYMSVSRWVRRHRLRVPVLLDHDRRLVRMLPMRALPCTWVLDRDGRLAAAASGDVAWLAPATARALRALAGEPGRRSSPI